MPHTFVPDLREENPRLRIKRTSVVEMVEVKRTVSMKRMNSRVPQAASNVLPAVTMKTKSIIL